MRKLLVGFRIVATLSIACQTAPAPAELNAGGPMPTATRPASAGGGGGGAPSPERGKTLVTEKGCIACHTIKEVPGATGTIGPVLDGVASRPTIAGGVLPTNEANLKRWLQNPPAVKPGTQMPNLGLNAGEIDSLVAFLQTLK